MGRRHAAAWIQRGRYELVVDLEEAEQFGRSSGSTLNEGLIWVAEMERLGWRNKRWTTRRGHERGGGAFDKSSLWSLADQRRLHREGQYKDEVHGGEHEAIIERRTLAARPVQAPAQRSHWRQTVRNEFGALLKGLLHCVPWKCLMSPTHSTKRGRRAIGITFARGPTTRLAYLPVAVRFRRAKSNDSWSNRSNASAVIRCLVTETMRQARGQATERVEELAAEERRLERELAGHHRASGIDRAARGARCSRLGGGSSSRMFKSGSRLSERRLTEVRDEVERLDAT